MPEPPEVLTGGNTSTTVLRFGDEIERDAGPWSPAVHEVLRHLEARGFPAPRSRGFSATRERLTYVPGPVVHPEHWELLAGDEALAQVFRCVRDLHEALSDVVVPPAAPWRTIGADPRGPAEMLCHNDLGPWNLVLQDGEWVFIDWDLLAPGRRDWELAWALITLIPINPEFGLSTDDVGRRVGVGLSAYGVPVSQWPVVMDVLLERVRRAESEIRDGAVRGEEPWLALLESGHADIWHNAVLRATEQHQAWLSTAVAAHTPR